MTVNHLNLFNILYKEAPIPPHHKMTRLVRQVTLIIYLTLACDIPDSAARLIINLAQPGLENSARTVDKRELLHPTDKTRSVEKEEDLETSLAELDRLEDTLFKLWKDLGEGESDIFRDHTSKFWLQTG